MSIYATRWILQFPEFGDAHSGCNWVTVFGQGVPAHIGTPTFGHGYEKGDPYADFLPPAIPVSDDDEGIALRAMVVVRADAQKEGQRYIDPLVILSGAEYDPMPFQVLHERICDALRGDRPRLTAEVHDGCGRTLIFDDE